MTCTLLITTTWNLVMIHIIIIIITILTHRVHATPSLQCLPASSLQPPGTYLPTCMYVCMYICRNNNKQQTTTTNSTTCMSHSIRDRGNGISSRSV